MNILGSVLKFRKMLMAYVLGFFVACLNIVSTPSNCSLEVWRMVIDNLTITDVSFFFWWDFVFKGFCDLIVFWSSFHSGFFVIFRCLWILGLDVRSMLSVNGIWS